MRILFLDTETTGLDPNVNDIVEVACEYWENGQKKSSFHRLVSFSSFDGATKNLKALQVNHYTKRNHTDSISTSKVAVEEFVCYLLSIPHSKTDPIYIGGHNTHFDVGMLKAWLKRHNYDGWGDVFSSVLVDTASLANVLKAAGLIDSKHINLLTLAECLKIPTEPEKAHKAIYDVHITAQCYYKMLDLLKQV